MEMLDPRLLHQNTTQIGDIARNIQAQNMQLQNQSLQNTQNAQNYAAMVIAQAAASGNPALYGSARQKLASMGIDVSQYSEDPAEAAQQAQNFRMMGATPTAQLGALMQQKQMALRAQTAGIDPSSVGLSSGGVLPRTTPMPLPEGAGGGDPMDEFLSALAQKQGQSGVSGAQSPSLAGVPQYDPAKYRTYKEYENALDAWKASAANDPRIQADVSEAVEAAKLKAQEKQKNIDELKTLSTTDPIVKYLKEINAQSGTGSYQELKQPFRKIIPGTSQEEKAYDLMNQARIDLAAPLAKQLGVNPTDRDFQASLDRIFDMSASQQSRAAQIEALEAKLQHRKSVIGGSGNASGIKFLGWE